MTCPQLGVPTLESKPKRSLGSEERLSKIRIQFLEREPAVVGFPRIVATGNIQSDLQLFEGCIELALRAVMPFDGEGADRGGFPGIEADNFIHLSGKFTASGHGSMALRVVSFAEMIHRHQYGVAAGSRSG